MDILLTSENQTRYVKIRPEQLHEIKTKLQPVALEDIPLNKQGIYLLTHTISEGKSYVGKAEDLLARYNNHRKSKLKSNNLRKQQIITLAIAKHGWDNFEIRLLEVFDKGMKTDFELLDLEEAYIKHYNLLDKTLGYNILARGRNATGYKWTQESREKRSGQNHWSYNILTGKHPLSGIVRPKEVKEKIKNAKIGKKRGKQTAEHTYNSATAHKKPINQLNKETGDLIKTWDSTIDAANYFQKSTTGIWRVCNNLRKSAHGFMWSYATLPIQSSIK